MDYPILIRCKFWRLNILLLGLFWLDRYIALFFMLNSFFYAIFSTFLVFNIILLIYCILQISCIKIIFFFVLILILFIFFLFLLSIRKIYDWNIISWRDQIRHISSFSVAFSIRICHWTNWCDWSDWCTWFKTCPALFFLVKIWCLFNLFSFFSLINLWFPIPIISRKINIPNCPICTLTTCCVSHF